MIVWQCGCYVHYPARGYRIVTGHAINDTTAACSTSLGVSRHFEQLSKAITKIHFYHFCFGGLLVDLAKPDVPMTLNSQKLFPDISL